MELSEQDLCKYFEVETLDCDEMYALNIVYRQHNNPSEEQKQKIGTKHYYHEQYRIYRDSIRPKIRRYVLSLTDTNNIFMGAYVKPIRTEMTIKYRPKSIGLEKSVDLKMRGDDETCIISSTLSLDNKLINIDVAYKQCLTSAPDTIEQSLESFINAQTNS